MIRSALTAALLRCWYARCSGWFRPVYLLFLLPLSLLFAGMVWLRRRLYRYGAFKVQRMPVPVIVVGNLNVGGAGKTPLTLALVQALRHVGWHPAIVSRGYGGQARSTMPVTAESSPDWVGDEPVLLARRAQCPLWIGRQRAEAARDLLAFHPEVDVLIADDGLQHLALARDIELVVVDAARGFGNGRLLPAGPLREPLSRLTQVDAVVVNGSVRPNSAMAALASVVPLFAPLYSMQISGTYFVNLAQPDWRVGADYFATGPVQAIAGIGHPQRFFDQLAHMGIQAETRAFADHHAYVESDLPEGPVLMTEKDAVKCVKLWDSFESCSMRRDLWFLAVDAVLDAGLVDLILNVLQQRKRVSDGSQIT